MSQKLYDNLIKEKYLQPTPIQMQAWPLLLKRREVLASAETGSGIVHDSHSLKRILT